MFGIPAEGVWILGSALVEGNRRTTAGSFNQVERPLLKAAEVQ
jgi:hypothetical protein